MLRAATRVAIGAAAVVVATAGPAVADHVVVWGAGTTCDGPREAATTVGGVVRFAVCVDIAGDPLPGHPMEVRVDGPERSVTAAITTDDGGRASFAVQPTAAGETTVTLCDADGCLYGSATIVAEPAAAPTTAPPPPPPAPTTTAVVAAPTTTAGAPVTTSTTVAASAPTTGTPTTAAPTTATTTPPTSEAARPVSTTEDDGGATWWPWLALLLLLLLLVALLRLWLRHRTVALAGDPPAGRDLADLLEPGVAHPGPIATGAGSGPVAAPSEEWPPVHSTPREQVAMCDWTVVYHGPDGPVKLRVPTGPECCRFEITIDSTVFATEPDMDRAFGALDVAALEVRNATGTGYYPGPLAPFRDGAGSVPHTELVIPTRTYRRVRRTTTSGIDARLEARITEELTTLRVQGASGGPVTRPDVDAALRQAGIAGIGAVAGTLGRFVIDGTHVEGTDITVTRHTPCADDDYLVELDGSSAVDHRARTSCVQGSLHGDTCGSELEAHAGGLSDVGPSPWLAYAVDQRVDEADAAEVESTPGSRTISVAIGNEVKPKAELFGFVEAELPVSVGVNVVPATGHNDDETVAFTHRPRPAHHVEQQDDYVQVRVRNVLEASAAVTNARLDPAGAEASTTIDHRIGVAGRRKPGRAAAAHTTACGCPAKGRECRCDPRFTLVVGGTEGEHARITVDGRSWILTRPPQPEPSVARWTITPVATGGIVAPPTTESTGTRTR